MITLPLAHALAARQDLPVPAWLFAWGASIVLIETVLFLAALVLGPRSGLLSRRRRRGAEADTA